MTQCSLLQCIQSQTTSIKFLPHVLIEDFLSLPAPVFASGAILCLRKDAAPDVEYRTLGRVHGNKGEIIFNCLCIAL